MTELGPNTPSWPLNKQRRRAAEKFIVAFDRPPWLGRYLDRTPREVAAIKLNFATLVHLKPDEARRLRAGAMFLDISVPNGPDQISATMSSFVVGQHLKPRFISINGPAGRESVRSGVEAIKTIAQEIDADDMLTDLVLTSVPSTMSEEDCLDEFGRTPFEKVQRHAELAKELGIRVISCSGHEVQAVKEVDPTMLVIATGIRFSDEDRGNHKRIMTPSEALSQGADYFATGHHMGHHDIAEVRQAFYRILDDAAIAL